MIQTISIHGLVPEVFADENAGLQSDIWLSCRTITIDRGSRVLVESSSGKGKSSLISFIYGRRTDYNGMIAFDGNDIRQFDKRHYRHHAKQFFEDENKNVGE